MYIYCVRLCELPCSFSCRSQSRPVLSGLFCLTACYQVSRPWEDKQKMISYRWNSSAGHHTEKTTQKCSMFRWHEINLKANLIKRGNNILEINNDACVHQTSRTCTCGWSPWSGFHPEPAPPQQCKSAPISLERHSCSSDSPSRHPAYTPSPCRGSGHLGMQKRAAKKKCWNEINKIILPRSIPVTWFNPLRTCTTQELFAKAMMSLSSQKKAESDLLIISNLLSSFIA